MPSATDFLPSSMTEFMNFDRTRSPNLGSGRMTRFSGRRRRDMGYSFQSGAPAASGRRDRRTSLFRALGAVLGARLTTVLHALRVEDAAQHMVAHARKVAHTAAADQHHRVLLQVVALTRDVADDLAAVGQAHLGDLAQRRVRLLRGGGIDTGTDAALLRILLHCRDLGLGLLRFATLADQLVNRRHEAFTFQLPAKPAMGSPAVTLRHAKCAKTRQPCGHRPSRRGAMFSSL